jgi:hypothetical protein
MNDSQAIHKFGQHLSDIQVAFILAFDKVKVTQRKIASLVNCSRNAVRTALTNYTFETFKGCKPRRNYQRITTEDEDKTIKNTLKHNSFLPLRDITNLLPVKISQTTLRRRRTEFGLGSYVAAKKPGLRPENVEANDVLQFLQENNVPVMECPAQSPDLNPLENLWSDFKERFYQRFTEMFNHPSKNFEARYRYGEVLQEIWYSQGMEMVEALINSMPRRCQAVIDAKGG